LEIACSIDTGSCVHAIRRFIARRGTPTLIRSENGTNIVGAERELRKYIKLLSQSQSNKEMNEKGHSVEIQSTGCFPLWRCMGKTHTYCSQGALFVAVGADEKAG